MQMRKQVDLFSFVQRKFKVETVHILYVFASPYAYLVVLTTFSKVTTIALSVSLSYLAIALGDGTVLLYRHLDQSIFSGSNNLSALPKPRVVHESPSEPVTGLGFREPEDENPNTYLYIITTNHVLSYQASGRGSGGAPSTVDEVGSTLGCATLDWKARDMVVAKEEAVYICGVEGRGACYVYEGTYLSRLISP